MLLGVAFLAAPLGPLVLIAFIPLIAALAPQGVPAAPRTAFRLGYACGLAFYLIGLSWIANLSEFAMTVPWLKYPAWIVAAAYLALFPAVACALAAALARRSGRPLALAFVPAWLAIEVLRAAGETGFPWFQPGYALHGFPVLIQTASLGSVTLVTAWVLSVNALAVTAWRRLRSGADREARGLAIAAFAFAVLLPIAWGARALSSAPPRPAERARIALVQGNIPGEIKWNGRHQREILARFLELSDSAATGPGAPALIVWPETATASYLRRQPDQAAAVGRFTTRTRVPVFSGYPDYTMDSLGAVRYVNGAGLFHTDGTPGIVYAKRHLVPFGERMPFQRWIPALGRLDFGQAEWAAGERAVLFDSRWGRFSCLVCFEAIFPDLSREDVRAGARWLVNVTNDEWFGRSAALEQHAGMAVFRAVENHVPLARCANTGVTLVADAYGRVVARLPVFRPGTLIATLPPAGPPTPYGRIGDWPAAFAWLGVAALLLRRGAPAR